MRLLEGELASVNHSVRNSLAVVQAIMAHTFDQECPIVDHDSTNSEEEMKNALLWSTPLATHHKSSIWECMPPNSQTSNSQTLHTQTMGHPR